MRPEKRLNVLGILTDGFTSMSTPFAVWMYTWRRPALFSGESSSVRRHWWVISGRASAISRPVLARMPWWSSQLRRAYFASLPAEFLPPEPEETR